MYITKVSNNINKTSETYRKDSLSRPLIIDKQDYMYQNKWSLTCDTLYIPLILVTRRTIRRLTRIGTMYNFDNIA